MSEENVQSVPQPKPKGPLANKKLILFSLVFLVVILAVIGVIFITANINPNAEGKTNEFSAASALEEIDFILKDGVISVMDAIDFNKLSSNNPISFIDLEKINSESERIMGRLAYLSIGQQMVEFKAGDKNHSAFDLSFETGSGRTKSTIDLKLDLYSEITEDYDAEEMSRILGKVESLSSFENENALKSLVDLFSDSNSLKSIFQGQNMLIEGNMIIRQANQEIKFIFEAMTIDSEGFFSLKELGLAGETIVPADQLEQLREIEGKYYSIDMAEVVSTVFAKILPQAEQLNYMSNSSASIGLEDSLEQFNMILGQLDEDSIDAIIRTSQPVKNIITDTVNNTKLFKSIANVDTIRATENTCVSGQLDIKGLVKNLGEGYEKIADVIMSDSYSNISESEKTRMLKDISSQTDLLSISSGFIDITATTCSDSEKTFQGFGLNFYISFPGQNTSFKIDFLNVSNDFSRDIFAPNESIDGTNYILDMIEQSY